MDTFKFENIKEKLKMKLGQISQDTSTSKDTALKHKLSSFSIKVDTNSKGTWNAEAKDPKPVFKVKRIVASQPKGDPLEPKKILNNNPALVQQLTNPNIIDKPVEAEPVQTGITFEILHKSVRSVKLPTKNWKIKMFMTEKKKPLKIVFTNKEEKERCVSFSHNSINYVITFNGDVVKLLAAPSTVDTIEDLSILLSIVDKISPVDPILEYI